MPLYAHASVLSPIHLSRVHAPCDSPFQVIFVCFCMHLYCPHITCPMYMPHVHLPLQVIELIVLFVCLSEIAETFFAPIMGGIADTLGLSHNVAGT